VTQLQRLLFRHWPQLRDIALSNCASAARRGALARGLEELSDQELSRLALAQLRLARPDDAWAARRDFLTELVVSAYERRTAQRAAINAMPLYPSEAVLWDEAQVGGRVRGGAGTGRGRARVGAGACGRQLAAAPQGGAGAGALG
jgi:intron-binding protein aquarius